MKKYLPIEFWILIFPVVMFTSCSDGGANDNPEEPPVQSEILPVKAVGTLPVNGEPCSDYEEVTGDDTKVSVLFNWNAAQFANTYVLVVLEGNSEVFNTTFNALNANVTLDRGKTYSWSVASVNDDGRTNGDTYSFTTPGIPIGNFAPYTAEISVVFDEDTSEMIVSWVGSDEDGDALIYDVKVFEEGNSIFEAFDLTGSEIGPLSVTSNTDYEIEVISRDGSGNFSISNVSVVSPE